MHLQGRAALLVSFRTAPRSAATSSHFAPVATGEAMAACDFRVMLAIARTPTGQVPEAPTTVVVPPSKKAFQA